MRGIGAAALEELSSWSKIPDSRRNLFVGSAVKRRPPLPGFDTCGVGIGPVRPPDYFLVVFVERASVAKAVKLVSNLGKCPKSLIQGRRSRM